MATVTSSAWDKTVGTADLAKIGHRARPGMKRRLLLGVQRAMHWSGISSIYARVAGARNVAILMYHSIAREQDEPWIAPGNRIGWRVFDDHCRYLARHRTVLALDEMLDLLERKRPIPARTVLLTFDDGYRDNLEVAAPILARHRLPATLYLATSYVDSGANQWEDDLYSTYVQARVLPPDVPRAYAADAVRLLDAHMAERARLLQQLRERLAPRLAPPRLTLTWDEVRRLRREYSYITLGVHTDEHVDLSVLSPTKALEHVRRSIDHFQRELGERPRHFSFPYSRVSESVRRQLPSLRLRSAMTMTGTVAYPDPWNLQRLEAEPNLATIAYWTSGAHPELSNRLFGRA